MPKVDVDVYKEMDEMVHTMEDYFVENLKVFKTMIENENKPLYPNCTKKYQVIYIDKDV